ncbi:uncharacterized protein BT62DRAFT_791851 [Guyanagaster necrorhizus]|uniref:Secreted protein n=1 Tax=Guyanagaster necrorhizus TaxID=856835 RepID=A0A9P7VXS5_9AGAR|nr:uncharacterized protein BT62DRAFT_791851 [Guyanagaster necrorhizus MCA 3950]KAG7447776.1 hypothetical protein BT62DRAFT_791851 [Guyanagaster necrorhizus MCA 3950]
MGNLLRFFTLIKLLATLSSDQCQKLADLAKSSDEWNQSTYGAFSRFCTNATLLELRGYWERFLCTDRLSEQGKQRLQTRRRRSIRGQLSVQCVSVTVAGHWKACSKSFQIVLEIQSYAYSVGCQFSTILACQSHVRPFNRKVISYLSCALTAPIRFYHSISPQWRLPFLAIMSGS